MNKNKASVLIFVMTVMLCFISFISVKTTAEKSQEYIGTIENFQNKGNNDKSKEIFEEFKKFWEKKSKKLEMIVHHEMLEDIEKYISELEVAVKNENSFEILKSCNCLKSKVESLKKSEQISLQNIF